MKKQNKCSCWSYAHRIGLLLVGFYIVCFIWYFIQPAEQELHLRLLRLTFFGFNGMNLTSFSLGAVQTYFWAYIGVAIWWLVGCCGKNSCCEE